MPANVVLLRQFKEFCEAWDIPAETLDVNAQVEVMKCYYLNALVMITADPPKVIKSAGGILFPGA